MIPSRCTVINQEENIYSATGERLFCAVYQSVDTQLTVLQYRKLMYCLPY